MIFKEEETKEHHSKNKKLKNKNIYQIELCL